MKLYTKTTVFEWLYFSLFFSLSLLSYWATQTFYFFLLSSLFSLSLPFLTFSLSLSLAEDSMGPPPRGSHRSLAPLAPSVKRRSTRRSRRSGARGQCGARKALRRCHWRRGSAGGGWWRERARVEWWHSGGRWRWRDASWLRPPLGKRGGRVQLGFYEDRPMWWALEEGSSPLRSSWRRRALMNEDIKNRSNLFWLL